MSIKKTVYTVTLFVLLVAVMGLAYCRNIRYSYYPTINFEDITFSEVLTEEECQILQKPVTIVRLMRVTGMLKELKVMGSGRIIYTANSERFGRLIIIFEQTGPIMFEVYQCYADVGNEDFMLFNKYQ